MPSGALGENRFPYPFQLPEAAYIPRRVVPSSIFNGIASLTLSLTTCFLLMKTPAVTPAHPNNPEESPHLKILHLITPAKSLCQVR